MNTTRLALIALAAALLAAGPAFADVLHLKSGGRVEGEVTDLGDSYEVKHRLGRVVVKKEDVLAIEKKPTLEGLYEKKKREIDPKSPDDLVALGRWAREQGWETQAKKDFRAALELDPDHRGAHTALGHVFYEGAWRTESEVMKMKGFVLYEGEWVTKEEAARLKAMAAEERKSKLFEKKLNRLFRRIASSSEKERQRAHDEVVTIAREMESPALEKFAGDAKAYYDRAWQIVRSQKVTMEVRAQLSELKRPIQTFQTSLGALSTPVNIQLPELSVASVGTTVVVPAGR